MKYEINTFVWCLLSWCGWMWCVEKKWIIFGGGADGVAAGVAAKLLQLKGGSKRRGSL